MVDQPGGSHCGSGATCHETQSYILGGEFTADSLLEGAVTSELVSEIRRKASSWHFIPPYARASARESSGEHPATAGRSAAGELVSEAKSRSLQGFNVKTGLARVRPGSNAAVLLVF